MFGNRRKAAEFLAAGEHLKGFIDEVLGAFQSGTGISGGSSDPITLDIARRLIWREISSTINSLAGGSFSSEALFLRVSGSRDGAEIVSALPQTGQGGNLLHWSVRCIGARSEMDQAVVYAIATPVVGSLDVTHIIREIEKAGMGVRDFSLGGRAY